MKCHQILTGACNPGDKTFAVGSVQGVRLTAYAAGCNITILANNFQRVQIIPGICHNNVQISCVDVSNNTGKVAVAYENKVCVFEPTPLESRGTSKHGLDYWWVKTGELDLECRVANLAWNHEGTRLLTAGEVLQMWKYNSGAKFDLTEENQSGAGDALESRFGNWESIWRIRPPNPVFFLAFSTDGTLFATAGKTDKLARIWYENQQLLMPSQQTLDMDMSRISYGFIYLAHPRPVTGFSWRDTSKYMPRCAVANMLVTNCEDNISRLWCETVLPDDGLISLQQLDPQASQDPHFRAHRQKQRFIERLKHMRQSYASRKLLRDADNHIPRPIPSLPSSYSVHDFHNFNYQGMTIAPGLHFHLAATINALSDIPLVPAMSSGNNAGGANKFSLHWLNNKEIYFSLEAEKILQELTKIALKRDDSIVEKELLQEAKEPKFNKQDPTSPTHSAKELLIGGTGSSVGLAGEGAQGGAFGGGGISHTPSVTSFNTDISQPSTMSNHQFTLSEALDRRIEVLLQDWHQSSDLLFSVHPVDGSLLVWVADFLDEYKPGAFRQAQVSFSSRIPNAIPIGDASTMSSNVVVFNSKHLLNIDSLVDEMEMKLEEFEKEESNYSADDDLNDEEKALKDEMKNEYKEKLVSVTKKYDVSPIVSMISKHENGTLNLWDVTFSPDTKFCQLLNISHKARVNGHRFRVNDITSHPVLPLLLTTSHHNMSSAPAGPKNEDNFCSELILWRVDPISPISKPGSGGISELARINSREISAFTNVSWIPTLLPSSVLGNLSNSPSTCFVSSDGKSLRVYQAVIDARSLLAELNSNVRNLVKMKSATSLASVSPSTQAGKDYSSVASRIVSAQSSARPGVVIELDTVEDAEQDWQNTILLHTFHCDMIQGSMCSAYGVRPGAFPSISAMVDLRKHTGFKELFYIVLAEKIDNSTLMHMWQLVLESPEKDAESLNKSKDTPEPADEDNLTGADNTFTRRVFISSAKVCTQELPLPYGVEVIQCVPAAGHLSSASIYPACLAPYLLVTACSDNIIRFWRVVDNSGGSGSCFAWEEWKMETEGASSAIQLPGSPVSVSAAFTGRIAVAYRSGESFTRKGQSANSNSSYMNLFVAIYECESSGGIEWVLEDKIILRNIEIPKIQLAVDQTIFQSQDRKISAYSKLQKNLYEGSKLESEKSAANMKMSRVPSMATISKLKEGGIDSVDSSTLVQKQLVQLDWVSNEDGSHLLTVAVANNVLILTTVSSEISETCKSNQIEIKKSQNPRPLLRKSSSMSLQPAVDEIKWMIFRKISLQTADGLPPLPMSVSWARDGVLMCAMDNEVAVYSQWKPDNQVEDDINDGDSRRLKEKDLLSLAQDTQGKSGKTGGIKGGNPDARFFNESEEKAKLLLGESLSDSDFMSDMGLFEASHLACPVLPQYHPKQLIELMNSGKIRWVKAILNHLVKCISPATQIRQRYETNDSDKGKDWSRSRNLTVVGGVGRSPSPNRENPRSSLSAVPDDSSLTFAEIHSVAPLPLWMLLEADKETGMASNDAQEYNELFSDKLEEETIELDILIDDDSYPKQRRLSVSAEKQGLSYFGPRQARILSKLLTHSELPGLTSLDQMHLMALADTVASCNVDITEKFAIDAAKSAMSKESMSGQSSTGEPSLESLDDCGLRFLLAMKHYCFLQRCLPISQRASIAKLGLNTSNIIWGFHSESEEELVKMIPGVARGNPTWNELKELGVVWWVRSNTVLRRLVEIMAKSSFQKNQEPLDAALFYLAMKKKSLVWGLYRSIRDDKMTQFFKNDFSEQRWRKAALKNAFALMGKQRFLHASAFFLLSGSLKDAMEIIISKLDDIQLAILVGRLYEGATETYPLCVQNILKEKILGYVDDECHLSQAHPDPFLRSIAYWIMKDYGTSLSTLLERDVGQEHPSYVEDHPLFPSKKGEADPVVFNFYIYLRTQPLIIRHKVTKGSEDKNKALMLSGFKKGSFEDGSGPKLEDSVTPLERKLFFSTASFHLRSGCPALALEVLSKLPARVSHQDTKKDKKDLSSMGESTSNHDIMQTGHLDEATIDWGNLGRVSPDKKQENTEEFSMDWGAPVTVKVSTDIDDELKLEWSEDEENYDDDDQKENKIGSYNKGESSLLEKGKSVSFHEEEIHDDTQVIDIIAQQMKFTACLKIMMEELSTLATGFESDGGLIRYQLYIWLEHEVKALKELCNYNVIDDSLEMVPSLETNLDDFGGSLSGSTDFTALHQVIMKEKQDFETRLMQVSRRKRWLTANETLLRTLLSFCVLHGANGGGLLNVRMELILLLQELQQEQTQNQLLSPLPFPTTLPLLSACIAQQKTVVIDPVHYLLSFSHDMLFQISNHKPLPAPGTAKYSSILLIRDLAIALSSCVYQSLCDSDNISKSKLSEELKKTPGMDAIGRLSTVMHDSYLMYHMGNRRSSALEDISKVFTEPSKWPGVASLRALLDRDKDDDAPNLCVLLCETYVAVYLSLLLYSLSVCDCHMLFRLVSQSSNRNVWTQLFGGGTKKLVKVDVNSSPLLVREHPEAGDSIISSGINTVTNITKQRIKLNMKLLNVQLGVPGQDVSSDTMTEKKSSYREEFVPPEYSLLTKFLTKPLLNSTLGQGQTSAGSCDNGGINNEYDTDNSDTEEEDFDEFDEDDDPFSNAPIKEENVEHTNPGSYSWAILRLAILHVAQKNIEKFLSLAGIELTELPIVSPMIYKCLRTTEKWSSQVTDRLVKEGKPPDNFIPGCFADSSATGPLINKYKAMLEAQNTPFASKGRGLGPIKRLWRYLVHQENVQPIFIRFIFGKSRKSSNMLPSMPPTDDGNSSRHPDEALYEDNTGQVKIIHKDQDNLTAFCMNQVSNGLVSVATPREILEVNMTILLHPSSWSDRSEDEAEYDILKMQQQDGNPTSQASNSTAAPVDPFQFMTGLSYGAGGTSTTASSPSNPGSSVVGGVQGSISSSSPIRLSPVVKRHRLDGVRRLAAHPHLPLYMSGAQDGTVLLWEWSHNQQVSTIRPPGIYAKVNRIVFSQQGNKFGVCDGDGQVTLWQAGNTGQSYLNLQLHNKNCADFIFQGGSSSLLGSAGHSSDGKNVALWDTLLPSKRACVQSFNCHDAGAACLVHATQHQLLISAGKKGQVCVWDLRQSRLLHTFKAHEAAIKTISMDEKETMFVTGSADGDIKVFDLIHHRVLHSFPSQHSRQGLFKNMSQGVAQLSLADSTLYSCGADGSFKMRRLPDREITLTYA